MRLAQSMAALAACMVVACGGGDGGSGGTGAAGDGGDYQAGAGALGGDALYSDFRTGKKLVLHQRDSRAVTPAMLRDRLATMEVALDAFDGAFLRLPNSTDAVMKNATVSSATMAADLEPLYALRPTRFKYNFAVVSVQRDLDPFDDWTVVLDNIRRMARVAREAGLVGLVIDNESIGGLRANYPYDLKFQNRSLDAYRAQTQAVSKQIMEAVVAEFPDAVVVVLRGAAGSEASSPPHLVTLEVESAQLLGSFFAGFVEGSGPRSLVVDGGTDYGLRSDEQFAQSAAWRKVGLVAPTTNSAFMSPAVRAKWADSVSVAFGVREIDGARANLLPSEPLLFSGSLRGALKSADHLVWASLDTTDMTTAAAGAALPTAARRAKAAAASTSVRLASTTPGSGTGLMAQYFSQLAVYGAEYVVGAELVQTVVDATIDFDWNNGGPAHTILGQTDNYVVVWTGYVEAPVDGTYQIFSSTDDGMQVTIGDTVVVERYFFQGEVEAAGTPIDLVAGMRYPIKVRYFQGGGGAGAHLLWQPPGGVKGPIPQNRLYPVY